MTLPSNIIAERSIVACCLLGGLETAFEAVEAVPDTAFFDDEAGLLFGIVKGLAATAADVDLLTVTAAWKKAGHGKTLPEWVDPLLDTIPSAKNLPHYAQDALRAFQSRKLVLSLHPMLLKAQDGTTDPADLVRDAKAVLDDVEVTEPKVTTGKQSAAGFVNYLERLHELNGSLSGLPTGFYELDKILCGLQFGEQTVVAARPSQGKTAVGLCMASHLAFKHGVPTLIISAEMSRNALLRRMLSAWSRIPMNTLKAGGYSETEFKGIIAFNTMLDSSPLYIVEAVNGIDCHRVAMTIQKFARRHGVKFVVVDYLQKVRATKKAEKRTYEVAEVSDTLKAAAVASNVALLTLAQLNRESEKDKGRFPKISDLADSGQIERDADTIMLIHRPRTESDPDGADTKLIIGKQRDGELGIVSLRFEGKFCEFQNPTIGGNDREDK